MIKDLYITIIKTGFPRSFINKIEKAKDGAIWVLGYNGITRIIEKTNHEAQYIDYSAAQLMSEKLNDFTIVGDQIYLATNRGLIRMPQNKTGNRKVLPKLYITEVSVNGEKVDLNNLSLSHSSSNLFIEYDAVSFHENPVIFRYRLHPSDEWTQVSERTIRVASLPSGDDYKFELQASIDGKNWTLTNSFSFAVLPPFWETIWFNSIVWLVIVIAIILLIRYRLRIVEKKHRESQKILQMRQEALSRQMNPHFVFNALGSVQNSILKGEKKQANNYLVKFSRLLRLGLDASRSELITLREDIDLISYYLSVEQTRMKDNFTFDIQLNYDTPEDILVPPFLLQPFAENAVKHGFTDKFKNGHIVIQYEVNGDAINYLIKDNGVGRMAAKLKETDSTKRESHGSEIAFQRIRLYGKSKGFAPRIEVTDLYDKQGEAAGTQVKFNVPLMKRKHDKSSNHR